MEHVMGMSKMILKNKKWPLFFLVVILCSLAGSLTGAKLQQVGKPVVAGTFYPSDATELENAIANYLSNVKSNKISGDIKGIIVPHAGYEYSAQIAAFAFKQVQGKKYDTVVILAPSHRDPFNGATIYKGDGYETPLGTLKIDKSLSAKIVNSNKYISFSNYGHRAEHSLEVELPFLQIALPGTKIIPIVVGGYDWDMCLNIGKSLAKNLTNKNVLLLASTDLYHGDSYSECKRESKKTLNAMAAMLPQKLCEGLLQKKYFACGGAPAVILQVAAKEFGANSAKVLAETNSNDVTGQRGGYVVGYGAIAVYKSNSTENPYKKEFSPIDLSAQKELLRLARTSISSCLNGQQGKKVSPINNVLNEKRGVFVTLTQNGQLRGCIGHHESDRPLFELVPQMAVAAAVSDPRFRPLTPKELDKTKIKVSVYLTNVYPIKNMSEFEMGVHGIIMQKNGRSATYLPEVPIEAGWISVAQEMESLCLKAGLNKNAWKQDASFWVYKTQVFDEDILKSEGEHGGKES